MHANGVVCRHLDGNPTNNARENIALGTQQQNQLDRSPEVRRAHAIRASSFITVHNHAEILAHYRANGWRKTLCKFHIGPSTLSFIKNKSAAASALGHTTPETTRRHYL